MFIMQGSGERLLVLEPIEGCNINCSRVSVLLKPSDFCKFLSILVDGNILLGYVQVTGFGGLEVACWPLVPKFAGSNPAEAVGFLRAKKSSALLPSEGK